MSGHNKWSQIKEKKGKEDAKKSKLFSMYARQITIESKQAKGDRSLPGLRAAIDRSKAVNMPNDVIDRAVAKGAGAGAESFEEVMYECFGPGGVAIIIEGITDNKNRTTPEIKHLLSQFGGSLGTQGSAAWAFAKNNEGAYVPNAVIPLSDEDLEKLSSLVEKLEDHDDIKNVYTNAE
ncbi:MAG: YebC/PmpR family DNA-binding transcriptional regulator [bacterium]